MILSKSLFRAKCIAGKKIHRLICVCGGKTGKTGVECLGLWRTEHLFLLMNSSDWNALLILPGQKKKEKDDGDGKEGKKEGI